MICQNQIIQKMQWGYLNIVEVIYAEEDIGVRPQCGQLKPRMLKIQPFWAYILDLLYKYLDISP